MLPDFLPENIAHLTKLSDSKLLLVDANILNGLKRSNSLEKLSDGNGFIGVVDIVSYEPIIGCDTLINVTKEELDALYNKEYPAGFSVADLGYPQDGLDDLSVISYTSGTSSSPKGVMLPARSLSANVEIGRKLVPIAVNEPGNTLSILPLAHIFGLAFDFLLLFSCGCHINIFTEKPVPARLLKALADVKPFIFLTVPLLIEKIFRSKVIPTLNKPAMRFLTSIPGVRQLIFKKVRDTIIATFGGNLAKAGFFIGGAPLDCKEIQPVHPKGDQPWVFIGRTEYV